MYIEAYLGITRLLSHDPPIQNYDISKKSALHTTILKPQQTLPALQALHTRLYAFTVQ